jgi:hypothetical protein
MEEDDIMFSIFMIIVLVIFGWMLWVGLDDSDDWGDDD